MSKIHGNNVTFIEQEHSLRIELTPEGRGFIEELAFEDPDGDYSLPPIEDIIFDLAEDIFCNSEYEIVRPEEVGALTGGLLIAKAMVRDDVTDDVVDTGVIYWDSEYMVRHATEELIDKGYYLLRKAD